MKIFSIFILLFFISCSEVEKQYLEVDKGSIIFKIYDIDSLPVNRAEIILKDSELRAFTDSKGIAVFEDIPEGKQIFIIKKFGFYTEKEIEIIDSIKLNESITINYSFGKIVQINSKIPFFIDQYEVTNKRYKDYYPEYKIKDDQEKLPVVNLTYKEAEDYCNSIGRRLCSRDEFITVCETENKNIYTYGMNYNQFFCNTNSNSLKGVGSFKECYSNWLFGRVYDMSGNASEWVKDDENYYALGGNYLSDNTTSKCSSQLGPLNLSYKSYQIGFRCCKTIE